MRTVPQRRSLTASTSSNIPCHGLTAEPPTTPVRRAKQTTRPVLLRGTLGLTGSKRGLESVEVLVGLLQGGRLLVLLLLHGPRGTGQVRHYMRSWWRRTFSQAAVLSIHGSERTPLTLVVYRICTAPCIGQVAYRWQGRGRCLYLRPRSHLLRCKCPP